MALRALVCLQRWWIVVVGQDPYFGAGSGSGAVDESFDQSTTAASSPVRCCDVERVEEHRVLAIGVDEFVTVGPTGDGSFDLGDEEKGLRAAQELRRVEVAGQAEESTRRLGDLLVAFSEGPHDHRSRLPFDRPGLADHDEAMPRERRFQPFVSPPLRPNRVAEVVDLIIAGLAAGHVGSDISS